MFHLATAHGRLPCFGAQRLGASQRQGSKMVAGYFFVDWCHCVRGYFAPTRLLGYHEYKMGRLLQDTANLGLTLNFASLFADTIMDILGCTQARHAILEYYQSSGEPQAIQQAINVARRGARMTSTMAWGRLL